jgi:hypothetical protein
MRIGPAIGIPGDAAAQGSFAPTQLTGLVLWLRADLGITLGATTRATGTAPPAVTLSGTPTRILGLHLEIDSVAGGTGLGQATFKWSENNGTTYVATGVLTAASVPLGTTGITAAFAAGPYNIDNKWDALVSQWNDQSGNANHAAQATASLQCILTMAGLNSKPALTFPGIASQGYATPSITLGAFSAATAFATNNAGYVFVHNTDAGTDGGVLYTDTANATNDYYKGSVTSNKLYAPGLKDDVARSVIWTADGTNAGNLLYISNVLQSETTITGNDPGTGSTAGILYIGSSQAGTGGSHVMKLRELIIYNRAITAAERSRLAAYMAAVDV